MADEMDSCEYIWNHELAMRRLLSLLRNGQAYCTDVECIDLPASAANNVANGPDADGNQFMWTFILILLTVLLYVLRPSSRRGLNAASSANDKPPQPPAADHGDGADGNPPPPAIH